MPRTMAQRSRVPYLVFSALLLSAAVAAHAQSGGTQIVGLPVFSADGMKIGQVIDVALSADRQIEQIRIVTGSPLGFGERTVAIAQPAFIIVGGRVMLASLSADDVQALPNAPAESP
jgi:sporulation protein YlmC with PRC-barrel domain